MMKTPEQLERELHLAWQYQTHLVDEYAPQMFKHGVWVGGALVAGIVIVVVCVGLLLQ